MSVQNKVAKEVAEDDFIRMLDAFDIDTEELDKKETEGLKERKDPVIRAIMKGQICVNADGIPTVSLKYPVGEIASVTFGIPTGESFIALGDTRSKNNVTKVYAQLGSLTNQPTTLFSKMRQRPDLDNCQALQNLFL